MKRRADRGSPFRGGFALHANQSGDNNVGVGYAALTGNLSGQNNTALGVFSLYGNSGAHSNTGVGANTLFSNQAGTQNTAIGFQALRFATGSNNIALGSQAGDLQTSGSNNIYIGNRGNPGLRDESGQIRIGDISLHNGTVIVGIYGANPGGVPVIVNSGGRLGAPTSSRRVKETSGTSAPRATGSCACGRCRSDTSPTWIRRASRSTA